KSAKRFDIKEIIFQPDSVVISGPPSLLDTIKYWKTQKLVLRDLSQDFEGTVPLAPPDTYTVSLDTTNVFYTIKVEEFTEKKLTDIPIEINNLPKGMSVFLYPPTITLQFQVGISEFEYINQSNFKIIADFTDIDFTKDKLIRLSVAQQPLTIKSLTILPQNSVEFIVMNNK
nr:YbbR-like domain-containing protein [Chitinophagales bacterium]